MYIFLYQHHHQLSISYTIIILTQNKLKEYPQQPKTKAVDKHAMSEICLFSSPSHSRGRACRAESPHKHFMKTAFPKAFATVAAEGPIFPKLVRRVFPKELLPTSFFTSSTEHSSSRSPPSFTSPTSSTPSSLHLYTSTFTSSPSTTTTTSSMSISPTSYLHHFHIFPSTSSTWHTSSTIHTWPTSSASSPSSSSSSSISLHPLHHLHLLSYLILHN